MPPKKATAGKTAKSSRAGEQPPQPFKRAPEVMAPFLSTLSPKHVYITHVDSKPVDFKRKIFLVPIVINVAIAVLFALRARYIAPWYFKLAVSALGHANETTVDAAASTWAQIGGVVVRRALTFLMDFVLFVFVWPWPVEFCFGGAHGSPVSWRWHVGFRDKEIYVRRSRPNWDAKIQEAVRGDNLHERNALMNNVSMATSALLVSDKTGYLTMNNEWDLDWAAMVKATKLVDDRTIALDAFRLMVVVHHEDHGWISMDLKATDNAKDDERRTQIFAFRDALAAIDKEDLFYRWIEIVQFESTQPGGFGPEKQVEVAKKIRDLFQEQGIDFDEFWKESVGSDGLANM